MRSRLPKWIALAALMLALPVSAFAQTSRVEGMALQGDYIKDYTGMFTYPSQVPGVGNLIYGELGNLNSPPTTFDRSVGAVIGTLFDGRLGTWAIHLREQAPQLGQGDGAATPNATYGVGDPNEHTNQSFDLMWGKKFGTTSIGLRVNRSFYEREGDLFLSGFGFGAYDLVSYDYPLAGLDPDAANRSRNVMGFGVGVGFELNPSLNAEAALLWENRTFELTDTLGTTIEEDSPTTYMLAGRLMWQVQPNLMVVPVFKWYSFDLSTSTPVESFDNSYKGWQAGVAGNWALGSNDLLVLGVTFARNELETEQNIPGFGFGDAPIVAGFDNGTLTESIFPQVFAALETHVNNWLTLRFGANKGAFYKIELEDDDVPGNFEEKSSPFRMNLGAGVKVGTLQLDAIVSDIFPQTLGWLGSGVPGAYFPKVTATYAF